MSTITTLNDWISANSFRTQLNTNLSNLNTDKLEKTSNLSDVSSASTARTNLGIDTTANQSDSTDKRFVTDAEKTKLSNLSGTNSGDQNLFSTIAVSWQSNVVADSTSDTLTFVAGSNVTITTDSSTDTITISATGGGWGGSGDVVWPASSTDNAIARYDGTTGKLLQNSGATIDDSGNITATNLSGTNTGDNAPNSNSWLVHTTWNETIWWTKTFSSDVIVPEEAYGAGWNGSLEVPTKNAVYDKIETLWGSLSTICFSDPVFPLAKTPYSSTNEFSSNTTMYLWLFRICSMNCNKISVYSWSSLTIAGDFGISIYTEDWGTRILNEVVTVSAISTGYTVTLGSQLSITDWNYWIGVFPKGTTSATLIAAYRNTELPLNPSWEAPFCWTITITASTSPSTITPSSITTGNIALPLRLDN